MSAISRGFLKWDGWVGGLVIAFSVAAFALGLAYLLTFVGVGREDPTTTDNGRIIIDNVTGCQYVTGGITGIYPRIGPDGIKIVGCKEQP